MPKTPDETKKGLECYFNLDECNKHLHCGECPNNVYTLGEMRDDVPIKDALALIQQLEAERDAAVEAMPRWISVDERLPEVGVNVIVLLADGFTSVAQRLTLGWFIYVYSTSRDVTHWMPLPEPPKGKPPIGGDSDDFVHGNHS